MGQIVCKCVEDISYLLWGGAQHDIWTVSLHDKLIDHENSTYCGFRFFDMRQFRFEYYKKNIDNLHHVTLDSYIRIVYPYFADILKFPYKRSDFDLHEYHGDGMDCSFLWPKNEMKWSVNVNQKQVVENEGFECLTNIDGKYPGYKDTAYHRVFCSSHESCKIVNESISGGSILISGDSYMIPVLPILSCYFHEVVSLDNRYDGKISNEAYYSGKVFDRVVISCSENNPPVKYLNWNLR